MNAQTIPDKTDDPEEHHFDDTSEFVPIDPAKIGADLAHQKLVDAGTPGYQAEFDPGEAETAGAFREDALTESEAISSMFDDPPFVARSSPRKQ